MVVLLYMQNDRMKITNYKLVLKVPFVASGGIANGYQMAAALALGADGINMGSRFCATQECSWPQSFKTRLMEASENDTELIFRPLHNTAR